MIFQQKARQTDCWQLPGCNRRADLIKGRMGDGVGRGREGWSLGAQQFPGFLWMVPVYLGIAASWYFHPLNSLVIPNSSISGTSRIKKIYKQSFIIEV